MHDWIEHDGLNRPDLPDGTIVDIRLRDRGAIVAFGTVPVEEWDWVHDPAEPEEDIVAYRVVPHE